MIKAPARPSTIKLLNVWGLSQKWELQFKMVKYLSWYFLIILRSYQAHVGQNKSFWL